jgi:23S rRNA (pseudouridine1915-N3)-methyltransferase
MRLAVLVVGRLKAGPERELCARYEERSRASGRSLGFTGPDVTELTESRERRPEDRKREEGEALIARLGPGLVIGLDERGQNLSSEAFSAKLVAARDSGVVNATFIIGGADGLSDACRGRAGLILSFGAMTLPHQLVRVLVMEQIYRAMTIMGGHPYHRS